MLSSNLTAADRDMPLTPPLPSCSGPGVGGRLLCHFPSLELVLAYTEHLSACDSDILSGLIPSAPQKIVCFGQQSALS